MIELIDRYVYAVTWRLPTDTRVDVSNELRANIEDMLPENATESDVRTVLEKLGNPIKLSEEYSQTKKYLIGPSLYDTYFTVLKLVIGIVTVVLAVISLFDMAFTPSTDAVLINMSVSIFVNMIVAIIQGATQAFLWVTLTFIILERTGINEGNLTFVKKKWSLDDLPVLPIPDKRKISRGETIFSMFCTVFFTALLYFKPQLIGWYGKGSNGITLIEPFFVVERLQSYIPIIILLAIVQLGIFAYKFITMHWSIPLAIANTAHNVALSALVYVMVSDTTLINHGITSYLAGLIDAPTSQIISSIWLRSAWVFVTVFIGICIWDSISGFLKCKK